MMSREPYSIVEELKYFSKDASEFGLGYNAIQLEIYWHAVKAS